MTDQRMLFRIIRRALIERRGRVLVAFSALVVGAAVATAMLSVYYDASIKMNREFRAYGANIMLAPAGAAGSIDQNVLDQITSLRANAGIVGAAPYLYLVATASSMHAAENRRTASIASGEARSTNMVLVGTWFDQVKRVSPWWRVTGRLIEGRDNASECILGAEAARQLEIVQGQPIILSFDREQSLLARSTRKIPSAEPPLQIETQLQHLEGALDPSKSETSAEAEPESQSGPVVRRFTVVGIVSTGGAEENQVFTTLGTAQELAGKAGLISSVAISAAGDSEQVELLTRELNARFDPIKAYPVRQIAESEGRILPKLRLMILLVTVLIFAAAALSVGTTLTALVIERRREIGTMKAIGATDRHLLRLFLLELGALGLAGGVVGYGLGLGLAQAIGFSLFRSTVEPRVTVFFAVIAIGLAVALVSALVPIKQIKEVEPAAILRGD